MIPYVPIEHRHFYEALQEHVTARMYLMMSMNSNSHVAITASKVVDALLQAIVT